MHKVKIKIDVTAPDRVLEPHDQTYVVLEKNIEMSFVPFEGLYLQLPSYVNDETKERYITLCNSIDNSGGIFKVDRVYYVMDKESGGEIVAYLEHVGEYTIESFHSLVEYLVDYYGFSKF